VIVGALAATLAGCAMETTRAQRAGFGSAHARREAALDAAIALVAGLRYDEAAARLEGLVAAGKAAGDRDLEARATFWLAYSREKQGRTDEAARLYKLVGETHPDARAARQAEMRLERLKPSSDQ
jgi:hypothetical protein